MADGLVDALLAGVQAGRVTAALGDALASPPPTGGVPAAADISRIPHVNASGGADALRDSMVGSEFRIHHMPLTGELLDACERSSSTTREMKGRHNMLSF